MASTYNQKKEEEALRLKQQQSQTAGNAALGGAQQQAASLADATQQQAYTGYMPSAQLQQAQQYVQQMQQQKPGAYKSAITPQLQAQFEAIMNRQPFQYDLGTDAMFQQMSDRYVQQGRRAMQDAIGEATALTGGYGNSYAQGVGQAAYGNYLQQLGAQAPQFQQNAFARWQSEGADMMDRYNMAAAREESDYARYQDALSNYWAEMDRAQQAENDLYNREYGQYMDQQAYDQQQAEWEQKKAEWQQYLKEYDQGVSSENREYAYNLAMTMLQGGQMPSADVLAAAGISDADAATIRAMYKPKSSGNSGGSSGSNKANAVNLEYDIEDYDLRGAKPMNSSTEIMERGIADGNIKITDTEVEDGILSMRDYVANREQLDPFYAANKSTDQKNLYDLNERMQSDTESYKDYVAQTIENDLLSKKITKKEASQLVKKYLMD